MSLEKNTSITAIIESIGANGEGIAKINGETVFIPFTLPGERVTAKIISDKKTYAFAKLTEIKAPADERAREECPVFLKCGGCQLQHMKYKDQLAFKTIVVKDCLKKIARMDYEVPICIKSDLKYKYRNKLQLPVGMTKENKLIVGFYASCSHRIIDIAGCPLHPDWNEKIIDIVKKFMTRYAISGYREECHTGIVRHIVVRQVAKRLQITIVINADDLKFKNELVKKFQENFTEPSIFLNINKEKTNVILGDKFIRICGEETLPTSELFDTTFPVSADSFLQVNNTVKNKLYLKALELSQVTDQDTVIDAYSGIGIMTTLFGARAKKAYGVEIVPNAIDNAKKSIETNFMRDKVEFILGDCAKEIPSLIKKVKTDSAKTIVVLDPPRKGVDKSVIDAILENKPETLIYISCSPQTLARDLSMLCGTTLDETYKTDRPAYSIEFLQPYDMFPQTKHVETIVKLVRN